MQAGFLLGEAVPLGHALVTDVARRAGVRVLFIKGPVAESYELRTPRPSADVDVWVSPDQSEKLVALLCALGWRSRPNPDGPRIIAHHSVSLLHDSWPCDIDVHHAYPGLLADDQRVFDYVWKRRTATSIADVDVPVGDRTTTVAVMALHALRDLQQPRNNREFEGLISRLKGMDAAAASDLTDFQRQTHSSETLLPLTSRLGLTPPPPPRTAEYERRLADWNLRSSDVVPTTRWIREIQRARGRQKVSMLYRAAWLPGELLTELHPEVPSGFGPRLKARASRLLRGVKAAPRSARAIVAARHARNAFRNVPDGES